MLVVLLVLAAGGFVTGMRKALVASGNQNNTILLGVGSEESLERSEVSMRTAGVVAASLDGILEKAGVEAISPEIHLAMPVSLSSNQQVYWRHLPLPPLCSPSYAAARPSLALPRASSASPP